MALRYFPTSSHFDRRLRPVDGQSGVPVNFAQRPLWLLRGDDLCRLNDYRAGHPAGRSGLPAVAEGGVSD